MIELKGVSKKFNGVTALKDLDFKLNGKGVHVIIGPNGSGKTTLLKILSMLLEPTTGSIYYNNVEVHDKESLRRRFTMVFQKAVLFNSTVYGNIEYGLKLRNLPREEAAKRIRNAVEWLGLNGLENRHVYNLSVGQQQRVSLARAVVLEPEILLLDEPTANLDPENMAVIEKGILAFSRRSTVVLATHNIRQTYRLADHVTFLDSGLLIRHGVKDILRDPGDERILRFVRGELREEEYLEDFNTTPP